LKTDQYTTTAILLRRVDYGEHDLIISFFSADKGRLTVLAKHAKKSVKRFGGILDLFAVLELACSVGRGKLPILTEASLLQPFENIRSDIRKTAYASYWAELLHEWMEQEEKEERLYRLLKYVLTELDTGRVSKEILSILFQMRLVSISGFSPNLSFCGKCRTDISEIPATGIFFSLGAGGIICEKCHPDTTSYIRLSKGTIKQLQWLEKSDTERIHRVRLSPWALREGLELLEAFVPYHLGKNPRSLTFLRQIRS